MMMASLEIGIKFEYVPVHLVKGDQRSDEFAAVNPMKLVGH